MSETVKRLSCQIEALDRSVSRWFEGLAVLALMFVMLITCVDVFGAKVLRTPVFGSLDMVMMAQLVAITFGAASTLLHGGHVAVELFVPRLPEAPRKVVIVAMELLNLALFVIIAWQLFVYGRELQQYHEMTPTARIPLYPFAYGITLAMVPVCLAIVVNIAKTVLPSAPDTSLEDM